MIKLPRISIISAVYNGDKYLEETIKSIINQTYDNIEYIIIDGGSTDGTLDIIKKYEDRIDYWISEKDKGISNAFNKGVAVASGMYINFQGDGDGFYSKDVLKEVFSKVNPSKDVFVCGRIQRIDKDGKELYLSKKYSDFKKQSLLLRMSLPHQALFTHINYFKQYGLFDEENQFCMDYEHLLRSYRNFPNVKVTNTIVSKWRADGIGNGRTLEILREYNKIKKKNSVTSNLLLGIINIWLLIKYQFKKTILKVR